MLMLFRGINETVMVGDDIEVKVLAVDGMQVLLGFKAPRKIAVYREEIYKRIQEWRLDHEKCNRNFQKNIDSLFQQKEIACD